MFIWDHFYQKYSNDSFQIIQPAMRFEALNTKSQQQYHLISKHVASDSVGFIEGAMNVMCEFFSYCIVNLIYMYCKM
jgi:hypothetical protein